MVEMGISHVGVKQSDIEILNGNEPPPKLKLFEFVMHAKLRRSSRYTSCAQVCVRPMIDRYYNSYVLVPEAIVTQRRLLATKRLLVIHPFPRSQHASIFNHGNGKSLSYHRDSTQT
jgi:hypothetical protein